MGLWEDAKNIRDKDPAARNVLEVIILYPGFHVLVTHRIAHFLYQKKLFFIARLISQVTGILTAKVATIEWAKQTIDRRLAFRYAFMQNTKLTRMQSIE